MVSPHETDEQAKLLTNMVACAKQQGRTLTNEGPRDFPFLLNANTSLRLLPLVHFVRAEKQRESQRRPIQNITGPFGFTPAAHTVSPYMTSDCRAALPSGQQGPLCDLHMYVLESEPPVFSTVLRKGARKTEARGGQVLVASLL